jgi:hypothetical protein
MQVKHPEREWTADMEEIPNVDKRHPVWTGFHALILSVSACPTVHRNTHGADGTRVHDLTKVPSSRHTNAPQPSVGHFASSEGRPA